MNQNNLIVGVIVFLLFLLISKKKLFEHSDPCSNYNKNTCSSAPTSYKCFYYSRAKQCMNQDVAGSR